MDTRIAIVGSGISGLTAAHLLHRRHEIVVFEADDRIGGHSHTIEVTDGDSRLGVDTGFIVYNRRTYPLFCRLLEALDVATQPSDMSFSFRDDGQGLEYAAPELRRLFAQPRNLVRPRFWRMLSDVLRFYREAPRWLEHADEDLVLGDYLRQRGYSAGFVDDHLYPVCAAIWSSPHASMGEYPAAALLRFFRNHGLLSLTDRPRWRTIVGGSRNYVAALTAPFEAALRPSTPVTRVERDAAGVTLHTPGGAPEHFDQVVLACHADQALQMLSSPTTEETNILGAFPYAPNETVLHSDASLMPRRRAAWSSWNYRRRTGAAAGVAVTYDQVRLQNLTARQPWLVTLNGSDEINPDLVHTRQMYHHPQYDARAVGLQSEVQRMNGQNRTHYCGAYWGYGFHEDGVASGVRVGQAFGEDL